MMSHLNKDRHVPAYDLHYIYNLNRGACGFDPKPFHPPYLSRLCPRIPFGGNRNCGNRSPIARSRSGIVRYRLTVAYGRPLNGMSVQFRCLEGTRNPFTIARVKI